MVSEAGSLYEPRDKEVEPRSGDSSTLDDPIGLINEADVETLTKIATQQSRRQSTVPGAQGSLATLAQQDPSLDPLSGKFDLRKWLKLAINDRGRDGAPGHTSDVIFKNLNVYGSGAALQFQDTVASTLSAPFRLPQRLRQSKAPQRRILKDFHGIMKSGELLLVLGRPGAGCSTFLKSLTGELHGLDMDKESTIHYNGELFPAFIIQTATNSTQESPKSA